jgi:hypothetical protein
MSWKTAWKRRAPRPAPAARPARIPRPARAGGAARPCATCAWSSPLFLLKGVRARRGGADGGQGKGQEQDSEPNDHVIPRRTCACSVTLGAKRK